MIPKIIHCCWFGRAAKNDVIRRCRESWSARLPDFEVREWNESNTPLDNPYCQEAMAKGLWSKVSNFIRLHALWQDGGIYLDTDMEVVRPFDALLGHDCFLGFQRVEEIPGWVNNAIVGARPGHDFLRRCLDRTSAVHANTGRFELSPRIVTSVLKDLGLARYGRQEVGDVTLYPVEAFYPFSWTESFHPECVTADTLAIHHWNHSWKTT